LVEEHQQVVQETLGGSAGVARQYCSETGKVDNCQMGGFLVYASSRGYTLLDQIDGLGYWYFMEVPVDTRVWRERPRTEVPGWEGRGRKPCHKRLAPEAPPPQTVAEVAYVRVVAVRDGLPGPEVWLVIRRDVLSGEGTN